MDNIKRKGLLLHKFMPEITQQHKRRSKEKEKRKQEYYKETKTNDISKEFRSKT